MFLALWDTVRAALHTLRGNLLRSLLTLLGIVIGIVAVVTMAATLEGLNRNINDELSQLGSGVFQVQRQEQGDFGGERARRRAEKRKPFTLADVTMLQQMCRSCLRVAGEAWAPESIHGRTGRAAQGTAIVGGTEGFFDNNGYGIAEGRLFDESEISRGAAVVVLGADVVDALFPDEPALGQMVRIRSKRYRVVGTLERRGSTMTGSIDGIAAIPISRFLGEFGERQSLNLTIMSRNADRMLDTQDEVVALLRRARGVAPEADNDFEMFSNASVQESFGKLASTITIATIGVCAISLLIGGIGVMNIMLVSVTERVSEIGVRRALGARRRRILLQFICEAVVLCALGGLLGIALGVSAAELIRIVVGIPTAVPMWAVAISLAAAGVVGLGFGIYPAWVASRLDPIEAMRQE